MWGKSKTTRRFGFPVEIVPVYPCSTARMMDPAETYLTVQHTSVSEITDIQYQSIVCIVHGKFIIVSILPCLHCNPSSPLVTLQDSSVCSSEQQKIHRWLHWCPALHAFCDDIYKVSRHCPIRANQYVDLACACDPAMQGRRRGRNAVRINHQGIDGR
jgi:hypothetical protein